MSKRARPDALHEPISRLDDIRRSEQTMVQVRWAGVVFAVVQVLSFEDPYPPGAEAAALGLAALLGLANVVIWVLSHRTATLAGARVLSISAISADLLIASGFVWVYAFDQESALWAVLFILPLEGAIRFALVGALAAWAAATVLYTLRELWGSQRYDYPFLWNSVSFRMGIGLLIALVAGMMARSLLRQRGRLAGAIEELRRTDTLRSRLVATLAHDVRNPLTTIRGTLQTLSRHDDRLDSTTRDEILRSADRQAQRLERLATDLLDLARTEGGRLELRLEDALLRDVVDRGLSFVDADGLFDNRIPEDVVVRADPGRLEQIVVNLATNALRYGDPPFVVDTRTEGRGIDLMFVDHGPGIPEADRATLFEPFRAESEHGSVGLGLAIVKALAEAHGGDAGYEPNRPRGACFWVTLPGAVS